MAKDTSDECMTYGHIGGVHSERTYRMNGWRKETWYECIA